MTLSHLQKVAVLASMHKAFSGAYFNVGGIADACGVLARPAYAGTPDWMVLRALHCTKWELIDKQGKQELVETCARVLGIEANDVSAAHSYIPSGNLQLSA